MASPTRSPAAGGALIAISILVGTAVGVAQHQPSIGFLVGAAAGVAIAIAVWVRDRGAVTSPPSGSLT